MKTFILFFAICVFQLKDVHAQKRDTSYFYISLSMKEEDVKKYSIQNSEKKIHFKFKSNQTAYRPLFTYTNNKTEPVCKISKIEFEDLIFEDAYNFYKQHIKKPTSAVLYLIEENSNSKFLKYRVTLNNSPPPPPIGRSKPKKKLDQISKPPKIVKPIEVKNICNCD